MTSLFNSSGFFASEVDSLKPWSLPEASSAESLEHSEATVFDLGCSTGLTVQAIEATQKQAYEEAFAQGKKDGFQQGYDEGLTAGLKKGYEENLHLLQEQAAEFIRLMEALSEPFNLLDEEVETELVKLAIAIATQIIRREIKMEPGQIIAVVKEAVKVLPLSSQKIYLHLHPDDAELVRSVLAPAEFSPPWSVIEAPSIARGGCKVDTEISHVDATVENRLAAVISTLFGGERQEDKSR